MKEVRNKRNLDPRLVDYLERLTKGKLEQLRYISPPGADFHRWKLVGIKDVSLQGSPHNGNTSLFFLLKPVFAQLWIPGEEILGLARRLDSRDLILDFRNYEDIFKKIPSKVLKEADKHRWIWEIPKAGELYSPSETNIIPGPYVIFN